MIWGRDGWFSIGIFRAVNNDIAYRKGNDRSSVRPDGEVSDNP
jgi:hypothetical protein